jgi:MoaA/NifB/PqqE/SkfB family radical SAM enzyme
MFRIVQMFLFDTCTHKCAYCHYAESGKVLDASQIRPYRDHDFIDRIINFFNARTTETDKWLITLTGGEPLLMPNMGRFIDGLSAAGNRVAFNTALNVGENSPAYRYLLEHGAPATDYIMASLHPEGEDIEDKWFGRVAALKQAGHSVIVRFVGHPKRLHRLNDLAERCRSLNVAFYPTALLSPDYPAGYTVGEKRSLERFLASLSQLILLKGGIDSATTMCTAGSDLISIDMRTGNFTPCISVNRPRLGNIYEDRLQLLSNPIRCPSPGIACLCDIHFQQNIVRGADDRVCFEKIKSGYVHPMNADDLVQLMDKERVQFAKASPLIGQTETIDMLALDNSDVKRAFNKTRSYLLGAYAAENHPVFKQLQFAGDSAAFAAGHSECEDAEGVSVTAPQPSVRRLRWWRRILKRPGVSRGQANLPNPPAHGP